MNKAVSWLLGCAVLAGAGVGVAAYVRQREKAAHARIFAPVLDKLDSLPCKACAESARSLCAPSSDACRCAEVVAREALNANESPEVLALFSRLGDRCEADPVLPGMRAEALARSGEELEATRAAYLATDKPAATPYVEYTFARLALAKNHLDEALKHAQRSRDAGRGGPAEKALGSVALGLGKPLVARAHFEKALALSPNDADAAFESAMCSVRLNRYGEARTALLRVTHMSPGHAEARFRLALLTLDGGALEESRLHTQKFAKLVPKGDPRLKQLELLQARPPQATPGLVQGQLPAEPPRKTE